MAEAETEIKKEQEEVFSEIDPGFKEEIKKLGGETVIECFNCGTCSAICPIHEKLPRRFIRYVQVGAKDRILENATELWHCLHCGLCNYTCPRGAKPGDLMLALRRYALKTWRGR